MRYRQRPQLSRIVLSHTPRQLRSCLIFDVGQYKDRGNEEAISPNQKFCFTRDYRDGRQEPQKRKIKPSHRE
jgi:hypothetical protein